jgi:putative flippase GtrA
MIDYIILLTLTSFGIPAILANYPSSTVAVVFSFFANKKYTFKASGTNLKREIILFLVFTLFCAWVIQPIAIIITQSLLSRFSIQPQILTVISKTFAVFISLIWNYLTYSRFVFKKDEA